MARFLLGAFGSGRAAWIAPVLCQVIKVPRVKDSLSDDWYFFSFSVCAPIIKRFIGEGPLCCISICVVAVYSFCGMCALVEGDLSMYYAAVFLRSSAFKMG